MATKTMQKVGFGKCDVYVKDLEAESPAWVKTPTPVDQSTVLTPTKGEKKEAKVEGGDTEDVLYSKSAYALAYQIRKTSNREMPIKHKDGVVDHRYAVVVVPREGMEGIPGPYIAESAVSVEDSFSTTDGGTDLFTHDAILPEDGSERKVKWGHFTVTKAADGGAISITANGVDFDKETTL